MNTHFRESRRSYSLSSSVMRPCGRIPPLTIFGKVPTEPESQCLLRTVCPLDQRRGSAADDHDRRVLPPLCDPVVPGPLPLREKSPRCWEPTHCRRSQYGASTWVRGASKSTLWVAGLLPSRGGMTRRIISTIRDLSVVLTGMPGLEKRLSRSPQRPSRVGFVHAVRPLRSAEMRRLLESRWLPSGVALPAEWLTDEQARAAIMRITGGNVRSFHRLLTQMARLVEIHALSQVTREVVEAARETLVIGVACSSSVTPPCGWGRGHVSAWAPVCQAGR
jgi:hypothetical protein